MDEKLFLFSNVHIKTTCRIVSVRSDVPLNIANKELFRKLSILAYYRNVGFAWFLFALLPSRELELDRTEEILLLSFVVFIVRFGKSLAQRAFPVMCY